ncbi:MAG: AbrB/MazE/SpoVT family DNA-binding domain-containing protein [Eubacteriales bacterium]
MKKRGKKYAWTVKIGEKGQLVIPKEARELFGIHPGDTIIVLADEKRGIAIPPQDKFDILLKTIFDGDPEYDEDMSETKTSGDESL